MKDPKLRTDPRFVDWAKKATKGLDDSTVMMGVWNKDHKGKGPRFEFELQIGHCLCEGKPIVLIAEEGTDIPAKLREVADAVEFFNPVIEESMHQAVKRGLAAVGVNMKH